MKRFRQLCAAAVLTLMFALSTFAGEMQFPINTPQPTTTNSTTVNPITMIVLAILQAIPLP